jgi:hypothetical protein
MPKLLLLLSILVVLSCFMVTITLYVSPTFMPQLEGINRLVMEWCLGAYGCYRLATVYAKYKRKD